MKTEKQINDRVVEALQVQYAARLLQHSIQVLYNCNEKTFVKIFGDDGPYMADKFFNAFERNEGEFICYLDRENSQKFARFVIAYERNGGSEPE